MGATGLGRFWQEMMGTWPVSSQIELRPPHHGVNIGAVIVPHPTPRGDHGLDLIVETMVHPSIFTDGHPHLGTGGHLAVLPL